MDVNELMKLKRPLTNEEMAFMEQEVLKLAEELQAEVARITEDLDPSDPDVAKLISSTGNIVENMKAAIEITGEEDVVRVMRHLRMPQPDVVYRWEKLPVYEWNNEFARVIGRLLACLPKRYHIYAHNLAGQASLISNCIALGHRDMPPGEVAPVEELRAYRLIGHHATFTTMDLLQELAQLTTYGASDMAHGMSLVEKIRRQFAHDLAELDGPPCPPVTIVH